MLRDACFDAPTKLSCSSYPFVGQTNLAGRQSTLWAKAPKSQLTPAVRVLPLMSAYI